MQKILLLLAVFVTVTGCKKNKTEPDDEPMYRVKTLTNSSGTVSTYEYDNQGRISKVLEPNWRWEYVYGNGVVTENVYDGTGALFGRNENQLNAGGLVVRSQSVVPAYPDYNTFTYTNAGMMATEIFHSGADLSTTNYYYSGNRLDSTRRISNGVVTMRQLLLYTDTNSTISNQHTGFHFWGKQSPKAIRTQTYYFYNAGGVLLNTQINNYSYELDAQGRITHEMMSSSSGVSKDVRYTYY
jgi:YD repeat-containing protein